MNAESPCFSRKSDEWETPQYLFDRLHKEFHFWLDAAATKENRKCEEWIDAGDNSLWVNWTYIMEPGNWSVWLNPPYSQIGPFMKKAFIESEKGVRVVCLIPSRTDTKWWHEYVMQATEIRFIKGRLKFGNSKNSAPFPSCIVVFDTGYAREDNDLPWVSSMVVTA